MITKIKLDGFKCFDNETVELKNLTLLTGLNSSGKSSLIQAILLSLKCDSSGILNKLGGFEDIKNKYTNPKEAMITIFEKSSKSYITKIENDVVGFLDNKNFDIRYLSANRGSIASINQQKNFNTKDYFDPNGLYGVSIFDKNKSNVVIEKLQKDEAYSQTLDGQLNYWLAYIMEREISFDTEDRHGAVEAFYKIEKINDKIKPENIGTGISYLVSILITALQIKEDNILIVENPEIHLHPKAQARLGEFFVFVANAGVQVIIETHNDHIINSICYQEFKNNISSENVVIQYKKSTKEPFEKIEIKNGQFVNSKGENRFPEGFFDATLKELFEING